MADFPDPSGRVLDYTRGHTGWGHDILDLRWNDQTKDHSAFVFSSVGLRVGDRLRLSTAEGEEQLYVLSVEPMRDPRDMFKITAKRLSPEGIEHFGSMKEED